jgi:tRNA threonylcarbamoyladenosine biosynthesis protein TsaB
VKVLRLAAVTGYKPLSAKRLQYIIRFLLLSMMMPIRSPLKVLALDTSTARGSVAVLEGREVKAELRLHSPRTHSTLLLKSIDFLLDRLGWNLGELGLVAAGIGPGSFTGIRIGISTALGIAQSRSIPFAGINGLDAVAHQVEFVEGPIGVLLDAHRFQVYYAEYIRERGRIRRSKKARLVNVSDLESFFADRHLYIAGDLAACGVLKKQTESPSGWPRPVVADLFLAATIGRLAQARKRLWRTGDYIEAEPVYIRPPDALRNKNRIR